MNKNLTINPPALRMIAEEQTIRLDFPREYKCPYTGRLSNKTLHYELVRRRTKHGDGAWTEWKWTGVFSHTVHERRWCDPDKPTFKRVVAVATKLVSAL